MQRPAISRRDPSPPPTRTHIVPAELQHGPDQCELLVDLLALEVREDLLEAVSDAVHCHVAAEDDTEWEHVEEDAALHWQLLVARRRLLLGHAVLEGRVVEVHLVHLNGNQRTQAAMVLFVWVHAHVFGPGPFV